MSLFRYEQLLIELHRLIADGLDESADGEALREQMDKCWTELTPEEVCRARALSTALN